MWFNNLDLIDNLENPAKHDIQYFERVGSSQNHIGHLVT